MRVLSVFGTRPEAIKMAPVVTELAVRDGIESFVCVSAQHRDMLDQVLAVFEIDPEFDLDIMTHGQTLEDITTAVLRGLPPVFKELAPDRILVHGDTTTTMAASLAAFYEDIPVGHVEAGLRSGNMMAPWPEEMNRRVTDTLCDLHFAPTQSARQNLLREGIGENGITVTGNTVIDALFTARDRLAEDGGLADSVLSGLPALNPERQLILVTGHRRENFGDGFQRICGALAELGTRPDVEIVYPVHLNPNVQAPVHDILGGRLPALRRLDGPGAVDHHRFRRHTGGSPVARQAGSGHAGRHRAAGGRRCRHGASGRHRPGENRFGDRAAVG